MSDPLRVVATGFRGFPNVQGGIERHAEMLYPRLAARGCEVTVLVRAPYTGSGKYDYRGVHVIPLPSPRTRSLETPIHTFFAVFAARHLGVRILHLHAVGPALWTPLARLLGLQVVFTTQGSDYRRLKWGPLARLVLRLGEYCGCRWANAVIAVTDEIAMDIRHRFHRQVSVIPNGVEPPPLGSNASVVSRGLTPGRYLLAVGRFVPEKGFDTLIEAFSRAGLPSDWRLVIAGRPDHPGPYSDRLEALAASTPGVLFTGYVNGPPLFDLYRHAGLFILPSSHEGLPFALLEAMSTGCPCLVSDIPPHHGLGLAPERLVPPGNADALAAAIAALTATSWTMEDRMCQQSRVLAEFDWDRIAEATLAVYWSLPGRSNPANPGHNHN